MTPFIHRSYRTIPPIIWLRIQPNDNRFGLIIEVQTWLCIPDRYSYNDSGPVVLDRIRFYPTTNSESIGLDIESTNCCDHPPLGSILRQFPGTVSTEQSLPISRIMDCTDPLELVTVSVTVLSPLPNNTTGFGTCASLTWLPADWMSATMSPDRDQHGEIIEVHSITFTQVVYKVLAVGCASRRTPLKNGTCHHSFIGYRYEVCCHGKRRRELHREGCAGKLSSYSTNQACFLFYKNICHSIL